MVREHYQLNGRKFERTAGDSEGQGSGACCSPWGHKESDLVTKQKLLNYFRKIFTESNFLFLTKIIILFEIQNSNPYQMIVIYMSFQFY